MARLQSIENALSSINETVFQELCDSFLSIRNENYLVFSRTGSQSGKQKTIKGTPDTFLLLPNGKYIFVEYSTNVTDGVSKLIKDLEKCIDSSKTGISTNQIAEIIFCVNFNLKASEVQSLRDIIANTRIRLTTYTLDSLSLELNLHHRDLTHEYLRLPLDTGQIVSIDTFIEEYNRASKGIATPLNNTFLHRETELQELKNSIHVHDFIILTGAAGVGKTKLSIEAMKSFLKENLSYNAYCISNKHFTILNDLYQYFDSEKDFLLFVDDANRIDTFNQITGFFKSIRRGKLKIIITVRDYAFQEVKNQCIDFDFKRIDIQKFSDEQITDLIKSDSFKISNPLYQKPIVSIADGNPRIAIMASLLAIKNQDIDSLRDVSELFEKYFSTLVISNGDFSNIINIKCLGLISFFYTIPYKNREITTALLHNFEITYDDFIAAIDILGNLELVETQLEYVKIPEQNLATYFFYKAFVKDNLLPFSTLLKFYFDSNANRFKDCVIPANNMFGGKTIMTRLQPELQKYWKTIENDEEKAFKFLDIFWYYLSIETLAFIYNLVESLPTNSEIEYTVTYEINAFAYDRNKIIELFGEFFRTGYDLNTALELSFEYVRKSPKQLPELIKKIKDTLIFDIDDERSGFFRQNILFEILINGLDKNDILYSYILFELSKKFLSFQFQHSKSGRGHTISFYRYPIPNNELIQVFRKNIWDAVDSNFNKYPDKALEFLHSQSSMNPDVIKDIMIFDVPFLIDIIEKHLTNENFEHCRYVQEQIWWWKRSEVTNPKFKDLSKNFTNDTYKIFLKLDWNRLRDKDSDEFSDYRKYDKIKEIEVRNSFVFHSTKEIKQFYDLYKYLKRLVKKEWNFERVIDYILDENLLNEFDLGMQLLQLIIENDNEINYFPRIAFVNNLNTEEKINRIWNIIQTQNFKYKIQWKLTFYDFIDDSLLKSEYVNSLIDTINEIQEPNTIHFDRLQRFLVFDSNLFQKILQIIINKNEKEGTQLKVWMNFFSEHFDNLGNDFELNKKLYLQQDRLSDHFDYEGKGFLKILEKDKTFLFEFIQSNYSEHSFGFNGNHRNFNFIWKVENVESELKKVFDFISDNDFYLGMGIGEHDFNCFFKNLQSDFYEKAKKFLFNYCKQNYLQSKKMNLVVDIVRHSMKELFEEILLLFISLNQDKTTFSKIYWRGNGGTYVGEVIIGDIKAAEWKNILNIVEKSNLGIKSLTIKKYLNDQIRHSLESGDLERQRRFLGRDW